MSRTTGKEPMFAVSLLELDRFAAYGETFGAAVGARLLEAAAARLESFVRCDYVAHIPEAAFVILIKRINSDADVAVLAAEILNAISAPLLIENVPMLRITANMGIAVYPTDGLDAQTLLDLAANALRCSKRRGRNAFMCHFECSDKPAGSV